MAVCDFCQEGHHESCEIEDENGNLCSCKVCDSLDHDAANEDNEE